MKQFKMRYMQILNTVKYFYSHAMKQKPLYIVNIILEIIVDSFTPFINIIIPKLMIDQFLGDKDLKIIIFYGMIAVLGNSGFTYLGNFLSLERIKCEDWLDRYFQEQLSLQIMHLDYMNMEDTNKLDCIEQAKNGLLQYSGGIQGLTGCLVEIIEGMFMLGGVITILIVHAFPLLIFLCITNVIGIICNEKSNIIYFKFFKYLSSIERGLKYVYFNLSSYEYGKDIRIYAAEKMMLNKAKEYNNETVMAHKKEGKEVCRWMQINEAFEIVRMCVGYIYIGYKALIGKITTGSFVMCIAAMQKFIGSLNEVLFKVQEIYEKSCYLEEFIYLMEEEQIENNQGEILDLKDAPVFEFRNVSFKYPHAEEYTLKNISVKLNKGEHIAIVGENGAGKTTFIKLLCRLYPVTEGQILLNGKDIHSYELNSYLKYISVVFQDFKLFACSIKENIILDDISVTDKEVLDIIQKVGLIKDINNYPHGIETKLDKEFTDDGIMLSGGQQQKLAIARTLFKDSPIVIMDEPTAALDPISEADIYDKLQTLTKDKMAIFISHRLSSCRMSNHIIVFKEHRIVEEGSHQQLISKQGVYANMYKLQATYYQQN